MTGPARASDPADFTYTFTPDLLASMRRNGAPAEQVDLLAARGTVSMDSLMEEVDRGELGFADALGMTMTAAYFVEMDRRTAEQLGDLDNWKPIGFLNALPAEERAP